MKKTTLLLLLSILLVSCFGNDEIVEKEEGITEEMLVFIHNNGSKKWKITKYYSHYNNEILDEDLTNCMKDDVYTFYFDKGESTIEFGESSCYEEYTYLTDEYSMARYSFDPDSNKLFLSFGRGAYSEERKQYVFWSKIISAHLISEDKMIFTSGIDGNGDGIVFEKIAE